MTQPTNQPVAPTEPNPPPSPPRTLTPMVNRRLWTEPSVRFWWGSGLVVLLIVLGIAISQYQTWRQENRLIKQGTLVKAEIIEAGGISMKQKKVEPDAQATLRYTFKDKPYSVRGQLAGNDKAIVTGEMIDIRIDPDQPNDWTYRTQPTSLFAAVLGALLVVPVALVVLIMAVIRQRQLSRLWRLGPTRPAIVIDVRQTALAPLSKLVRVTPRDYDKRMYSVYVPGNVKRLQQGDSLWLIASPDNPAKVAAAVWFE